MDLRNLGPINEHSAFIFECMFASLKKAYVSGTTNVGKQCLENMLLSKKYRFHSCVRNLLFRDKSTSKTNDTLVYVFQNNQYTFFKIDCKRNNDLICKKISTTNLPQTRDGYQWGSVGVFQFLFIGSEETILNCDDISGKAICVKDWILSVPSATLREN